MDQAPFYGVITGNVLEFSEAVCTWWSVHEKSAGFLVPLWLRYLLYYLSQQLGLWQPQYMS